ncbi:cytochrome P450 family protein [Streptomyces tsukubensis]|uniref:Cytochrome P450 n=1 Tax=Streptomyces tsukubensis TaxID=83656 RepID=A0A1V4AFX7_9ACTN|nr:cytochrome P450 [Streptomyces tsukubensis]OON82597.1 cytochrome P450 [Streptomyces tsukubensis]QFR92238.1 cytochrome P450 [Streptomyces tsukubensis]
MASCPHATALFTPEFVADPYPVYATLREEGRTHRVTLPGGVEAWLLTRYEDCRRAFLDNDSYSKDMAGTWTAFQEQRVPVTGDVVIGMGDSMLVSDQPRHTRLRALVSKGFTPRRIEALAPDIEETAVRLLDDLLERDGDRAGHADLTTEFAALLPMEVIRHMLDVPAEDGERLRRAVEAVMSNDEDSRDAAMAAFQEVHGYLGDLVKRKRERGGDDLTSALIDARDQSDRLTEEELVSMLALLLSAGHETTVNLLGSTVLALLRHPDQLDLLRREPDRWPAAVEEALRWDGPIQNAIWRFTRVPVTIGDVTIPAGEAVALSVAAADRDPAHFLKGEEFDITRGERSHMAFGHGIHHCLGAPLARLEARTAVPLIFEKLSGLRLDGEPAYRPSTVSRALSSLPVAFGTPAG